MAKKNAPTAAPVAEFKAAHVMNKSYSFELDGMYLTFSLPHTPDKKQLKQFKELLERAIEEVTADIGPQYIGNSEKSTTDSQDREIDRYLTSFLTKGE